MQIPRRPKWDANTTADELKKSENKAFLNWRRAMAVTEEDCNFKVTPFEKNLDIWRQLWRVLERSDLVVQIVDARNPLLYYSKDLFDYAKETSQEKTCLLLVNKSDFLSEKQRRYWGEYFEKEGIVAVFFSNFIETPEDDDDSSDQGEEEDGDTSESDEEGSDAESSEHEEEDTDLSKYIKNLSISTDEESEKYPILSPSQLIDYFRQSYGEKSRIQKNILSVGLVGYPNVGKSSTINSLLSMKRVAVSSTPGKTKHFQTFYIDDDVMLCDCPGLTLPSFVSSTAEMLLNAVLPINHMRDYISPTQLACSRIPRKVLEYAFGINLPYHEEDGDCGDYVTAQQVLITLAVQKGYKAHKDVADRSKAARLLLNEYVNGRSLVFCRAPPGIAQLEYHSNDDMMDWAKQNSKRRLNKDGEERSAKTGVNAESKSKKFDEQFFKMNNGTLHVCGKGAKEILSNGKKHGNANKKEKRRRLYGKATLVGVYT